MGHSGALSMGRGSSEKGNVGPSGDTERHDDGFSEMTLRGLGWTPRGLRWQTRGTLKALSVGCGFSHGVNLVSKDMDG